MAEIFMAKWDIKDGFWYLDCTEGEAYNFAHILSQPEEEPIRIVIPTLLQMEWVESPRTFARPRKLQGTLPRNIFKCLLTHCATISL
jgi:hypothetical protein